MLVLSWPQKRRHLLSALAKLDVQVAARAETLEESWDTKYRLNPHAPTAAESMATPEQLPVHSEAARASATPAPLPPPPTAPSATANPGTVVPDYLL